MIMCKSVYFGSYLLTKDELGLLKDALSHYSSYLNDNSIIRSKKPMCDFLLIKLL